MDLVDLFGYLSSIVILISLTMSSIVKLRWINMVGAGMFTIYGLMLKSVPTAFLNFGIVIIDLYYLYKLYMTKEEFKLVEAINESPYLNHFFQVNNNELSEFVDRKEWGQDEKVFYMLRNNHTAGVLAGKEKDRETLFIDLDFVTVEYRDMKLGRYFFHENKGDLQKLGYKKVVTNGTNDKHRDYLKKIGFVEREKDVFEKVL